MTTLEKTGFPKAYKNKFFVNCVHVKHKLKIQKNMEKHWFRPTVDYWIMYLITKVFLKTR